MSRHFELPDHDEPEEPMTAEEEKAEAWEYWHQRCRALEAALYEIRELADERADADDGIPNFAMRILTLANNAFDGVKP